jgi:hypothetical protein
MGNHQLPLISQLNLEDQVEQAPSRRAVRKLASVSDVPYVNAVQALLQGPVPLAHLVRLEAAINGVALVDALREFGLQLPIYQVPMVDINHEVLMVEVCVLSAADVRHIHRVIKKLGGGYA